MAEDRPIYDETGSKLLVQAILASDDISTMSAVNGLRRYINGQNLPPHDIKVFFAGGSPGTWMSSVMSLVARDQKARLEAEAGMRRFRKRLAVLETAFRRIRNITKDVSGSDSKDSLLQWFIDAEKGKINDSDVTGDPADAALARYLAQELEDAAHQPR